MCEIGSMENQNRRLYTIMRQVEDGQRVPVSTLEDYQQAQRLISSLSEYWPGGYSILQSDAEHFTPLPVSIARFASEN